MSVADSELVIELIRRLDVNRLLTWAGIPLTRVDEIHTSDLFWGLDHSGQIRVQNVWSKRR